MASTHHHKELPNKSTNNKREAHETTISSGGQNTGEKENIRVILAAGGLVWRESPRGKELAVIHRPSMHHKDWTLPKGHPNEGENLEVAALREVREETGCDAKLESFAGCVSYTVEDAPKVVLYWNMSVEGECAFEQSKAFKQKEVDQLLWLPVQEAIRKLDYPGERKLIMDKNGFLNKKPSLQSRLKKWFKKLFWSAEHKRLAETIGPYRDEMEHYICFRKKEENMKADPWWATAVCDLLDKAQNALENGDIELGWRYFGSAELMAIYGLDGLNLRMRAQAILNEAEEKLGSWRKKTVKSLLEGKLEGEPKEKSDGDKDELSGISHEEVYYASRILQEYFTNLYRKLRIFRRQLYLLSLVALLAAIIWLSVFMPSLNGQEIQINNRPLLFSVALFGIMGAAISGMFFVAGGSPARIPEQLSTEIITLTRPVIGVVAALVVFAFLVSGLLQVGEMTPGLVLAISFASGFSEQLVMRAVEGASAVFS